MKKSIEFLSKQSIKKTDYLIIGCSGGPDSMCLLNILKSLDYKIVCAHVNHNIRLESKDEYAFVKKYCLENKIIFEGLELLPSNQSEAFYRKKRQNFYKTLADKYNSPYILTAHHGDDLIETILMRLTRGSTLKGYAGFQSYYQEDKYIFLKPLLFYTKKDILTFNKKNKIPYVLDSSNDEDTYTRNRYRHQILPFLKEENKEVHLKYLQFSKELYESNEFINNIVTKKIKENYSNKSINLKLFMTLDLFIQKRELSQILKEIYKDNVDKLQVFHIDKIIELLNKEKNFSLDLPLNISVIREYNVLKILTSKNDSPYQIEFKEKIVLPNKDIIERVEESDDSSNNTIRLNSKDVKLPLYVRTKKEGDKIAIKNLNGTKSIKSIFIDEKIPASMRKQFPILVDSNDTILWLPSLRKSKFDINKTEKYDIILKYTKKGDKTNEEK